ncbi:MAG: sigma 54-interacting transcriptional regulator [Deltaproteobacteria bacterium]|nr:sigma 54-interacting transcriptional regulator [Deltaproteobacteria bacterium]
MNTLAPEPIDGGPSTLELRPPGRTGPWVVEVGGSVRTAPVLLAPGHVLVLGSSRRADLCVEDPTVSAVHARLTAGDRGLVVEDLGSRNGVHVGGAKVTAALLDGDSAAFVLGATVVEVRAIARREEELVCSDASVPGLVGSSLPMRRLAAEIRQIARLRAPVLVLGESGVGKDVVARALHAIGRPRGPYVALNVATIPEPLADAELFGHRRGAFTGATAARPGAFEAANRGTLFLDEVGDLPPSLQVKLLRVLEDRSVRPVGGTSALDVDVRVVTATWAELEQRARDGSFRQDLLARISTFVLRVPPLRSRRSDVPLLAVEFLRRLEDELGRLVLEPSAVSRLLSCPFPGNVRELGAVLYRAAARARDGRIAVSDVEAALGAYGRSGRPLGREDAQRLLLQHQGNVSRAARAAGVPRGTFRFWLGLDCPRTPGRRRAVGGAPAEVGHVEPSPGPGAPGEPA